MRQQISQSNMVPRLVLVVLAILVCQAAEAQTDDFLDCCPPGFFASRVHASFEEGTTRERIDEIATELNLQIIQVHDNIPRPIAQFCVPLGEESAHATMLRAFPEVRNAGQTAIGCASLPRCDECCPCGFDCPSLAPCESECEIDTDSDTFADNCDTCTDTDGDGFGDPEFEPPLSFPGVHTCPDDNCPDSFNQDQADLDSDGIGDECDRRLTICHRPPGKPAAAHTIEIAVRAYPAHLVHGDVPGSCVVKRRSP